MLRAKRPETMSPIPIVISSPVSPFRRNVYIQNYLKCVGSLLYSSLQSIHTWSILFLFWCISFSFVIYDTDKDYNRGLLALQTAVAEEEKRLEDEDRSDVANYRKGIVHARRQSLIYRNQFEVFKYLCTDKNE